MSAIERNIEKCASPFARCRAFLGSRCPEVPEVRTKYWEPAVVSGSCAAPFQPGSPSRSWNLKVGLFSLVHQAGLSKFKAKPDANQQQTCALDYDVSVSGQSL